MSQAERLRDASREAGADMSKEEFARVIGGLAKTQSPAKGSDEDQAVEDAA